MRENTWNSCNLRDLGDVEQLESTWWMLLYSDDFWHYLRKLIIHKKALLLTYSCRGFETFRELSGPMKVDCDKLWN